jgi:hypothetical protein
MVYYFIHPLPYMEAREEALEARGLKSDIIEV